MPLPDLYQEAKGPVFRPIGDRFLCVPRYDSDSALSSKLPMNHLDALRSSQSRAVNGKSLLARATGRFYTPREVGIRLAHNVARNLLDASTLRIADPFCGDGRLLQWLIEALLDRGFPSGSRIELTGWDVDDAACRKARKALAAFVAYRGLNAVIQIEATDTFFASAQHAASFDCVITNPPWEALKPDRRELDTLDERTGEDYIAALARYDRQLADAFPLSQPSKKFSGWGTNLSRAGLEVAARLTKDGGQLACVAPAALLTDQSSWKLRRWLVESFEWLAITHYPAEARLFKAVDTSFVTFVCQRTKGKSFSPTLTRFDRKLNVISEEPIHISSAELQRSSFVIPAQSTDSVIRALSAWADLPVLAQLQGAGPSGLWLGRELDETGRHRFTQPTGSIPFVKGRLVGRYRLSEEITEYLKPAAVKLPASMEHPRVAWRDVARRSQRRRMHAAIVPLGMVTGNSLHVGYFRDDDLDRLLALLAILNSYCFEAQVNARLGTGHISLGTVKQTHIPRLERPLVEQLAAAVKDLDSKAYDETTLEVLVAQAYGLDRDGFAAILSAFTVSKEEHGRLMGDPNWNKPPIGGTGVSRPHISNHVSARLSALDLQVARAVPPGGNWKNIPKSVPSKRLDQIRESYAAGEGSRSTYYGRLQPEAPAYTINTYFTRPGNGCHLHYDYEGGQHRVLSHREAARLQSFPDTFVFRGSLRAVAQQIGNAVPPLLAYQIARTFPTKGQFVDLFCGAGGMSLGFKWAGWEPLAANDIDGTFLDTYRSNIHETAIEGSINDDDVFDRLLECVSAGRDKGVPLAVLGGPPCQGFSTAGNRRSMGDERNSLFYRYRDVLMALKPELYVFENVTGLLNMDGGVVFETVRRELSIEDFLVRAWKLNAEEYGVPQRRTRLIIMGTRGGFGRAEPPEPVTRFRERLSLFDSLPPAVTVREALDDLPPLEAGEDGSVKDYLHEPENIYQHLMRGRLSPEDYLARLRETFGGAGESEGTSSRSHRSVRM